MPKRITDLFGIRPEHDWNPLVSKVDEIIDSVNTSYLPLNSRLVWFGDSITAQAYGTGTNQVAYQNIAFPTFAQLANGNRFYTPIGGNKGISGNTTAQMIARLGSVLQYNAKVAVVHAGTNDLASVAANVTFSNIVTICKALVANGTRVILIPILPRFGANAISVANETKRLTINGLLPTLKSNDITVLEVESAMNSSSLYVDGLHPNSLGSSVLGNIVGQELNKLIKDSVVSDVLVPDNSHNFNLYMTGTTGVKQNGATGNVITNWFLNASSIGANVVGSISTVDNLNSQQININGSYTGTGKQVIFFQNDFNTYAPIAGDIVEGLAEIEILTNDPNVLGNTMNFFVWDSGYATLCAGYGYFTLDQLPNQLEVNRRYVLRTPPIAVAAGTPTMVHLEVDINLKDAASPTPINFAMKIHKVGLRKVNTL